MVGSQGEQFGAVALVIVLSAAAGAVLGMLAGFQVPQIGKFGGFKVKPILTVIRIPPIIAMIIMGCIVRNFFGDVVQPYNVDWAQWIRMCCLACLLVRGGLLVSFSGKGILVVLLTFVPLMFEATSQALVSYGLFAMPIEVCFAQGFAIASVAPAIVVPQLMRWNELGYGRSKGIAGSLIASCTFDNITCLILFGICRTITFQYAAENKGLKSGNSNFAWQIASIFVQNIAGLAAGIFMGFVGWFFKHIEKYSWSINLKALYCIVVGISFIIASELSKWSNAKYIACLSFGYICNRMWGDKKPAKELATFWFYVQPFLFGTIGAALLFSQVRPGDVGRSIVCIFCGQIMRFAAVFFISHSPKYTVKERIFMALSWIPKSTVPATLASVIFTDAKALGANYADYQAYGLNIQTTTIVSIIICEPIGSFLIDQFAPKLLTIGPNDPARKAASLDEEKADCKPSEKQNTESELVKNNENAAIQDKAQSINPQAVVPISPSEESQQASSVSLRQIEPESLSNRVV